ncbi:O-antigen ligase family protein [Clostridium perfringens]|nr:O-antigen ligase family protein [Clostridium perfringens]MDM0922922.1 O-antigen ligase family protein [Clostridium perfringens]
MEKVIGRLSNIFLNCFILGIYIFSNKSQYNYISNLMSMMFIVTIIIQVLNNKKIKLNGLNVAFLIFLGICFFSIFTGEDKNQALIKCKTLTLIYIFIFCLNNYLDSYEKIINLLKMFIISGIIASFYVLSDLNLNNLTRLGSDIGNQNLVGALLSISFLISIFFILYKNKKNYIILSIILLISILLTGSRTGIIFILIGLSVLILVKLRKNIIKVIIGLLILLIVIIILYKIIMQNYVIYNILGVRIEGMLNIFTGNGVVDSSSIVRRNMIDIAKQMFLNKPIWGYGLASYGMISGFGTYSHNNLLELLIGVGIIGTISYYSMYIIVFINLIKCKCDIKWIILVINLCIIITGLISSVQYYDKHTYIMLAIGSVLGNKCIDVKDNKY